MTKLRMTITLACVGMIAGTHAQTGVLDQLLAEYRSGGATAFDPEKGRDLWTRSFGTNADGKERSCSTCHTDDLKQVGKHVKTGKGIDPLAPSVNRDRLTDAAEIEKWFKRNCEWTLGRECNAQEKGDFIAYIRTQ